MVVDRPETRLKGKDVEYYGWAVYDVTVSPAAGDTVTLGDFSATTDLKLAKIVQKSDGSEVTTAIANNVVTTSGLGTDLLCVLFAFGVKA